ncbi:MAG: uracil-DNA glycosylase [Caldilineae bacterium]|nr:uracil-DNA glycosylase [Caldilineae bacterium]
MSSAARSAGPASSDPAVALGALEAELYDCRRCPRLVAWREQVAVEKRRAYVDQDYWARPVPGFGDPEAWLLVVGLAPGAHGSNRTGRPFTGDRSGDWLFASLHRAGLASQAEARARGDGLRLTGVWITACVRCAPPGNKPSTAEWSACQPYLVRELSILAPSLRAVVCLGGYAFDRTLRVLAEAGRPIARPRPRFGHGVLARAGALPVLGCYHPSQQNTFTGKLTEAMLDGIWQRAIALGATDGNLSVGAG